MLGIRVSGVGEMSGSFPTLQNVEGMEIVIDAGVDAPDFGLFKGKQET